MGDSGRASIIDEGNKDSMMLDGMSYKGELYIQNPNGRSIPASKQPSQRLGAKKIGTFQKKHTKPRWKGDSNQDPRSTYLNKIAQLTGTNVKRREDRFNMGDPGQRFASFKSGEIDITSYSAAYNTLDKINALDILKTGEGSDISLNDPALKDMIRFKIEAVNSDNPLQSETMVFRAFLDDWSDQYDAGWNSFKYNGRGEEFYTYDSFKRKVGFSFKIAAQSRSEMMPLYRKLNYLVSQTAPDYKNLRMRGNFVKISIGDLMDRTPGIINSVGLKWQKDYPWEIANDEKDTDMLVLPHVLDVNVSFTPIHSFLPQKGVRDVDGNLKSLSPFILPSKINSDNLSGTKDWSSRGAKDSLTPLLHPTTTNKPPPIEEDTSGIKTGEINGAQTPDSRASAEEVSSNTSTHTGPPMAESIVDETVPLPQPEANNPNPTETNTPAEVIPVEDEEKALEVEIVAPQPDSKYPGGSMEVFYGLTMAEFESGEKKIPSDGGKIYETDWMSISSNPEEGGDPPILRAICTCTTPNGAFFSYMYAVGTEWADSTFGAIKVGWNFDATMYDNSKCISSEAIGVWVEAKGLIYEDTVTLSYITKGDLNDSKENHFFDRDLMNRGNRLPKIMNADFQDRVSLAKALLKILNEEGKKVYPDYKVEIA